MRGFSFVDGWTAGMPRPGRHAPLDEDLVFLANHGIALIVSLTPVPPDPPAVRAAGMDLLHLPIVDMERPSPAQQIALVEELRRRSAAGERTAVHCTAGLGRTGTMLATWLVAANGHAADDAIAAIRELRPGSIETAAQEQAVRDFAVTWGQGF